MKEIQITRFVSNDGLEWKTRETAIYRDHFIKALKFTELYCYCDMNPNNFAGILVDHWEELQEIMK